MSIFFSDMVHRSLLIHVKQKHKSVPPSLPAGPVQVELVAALAVEGGGQEGGADGELLIGQEGQRGRDAQVGVEGAEGDKR